MIGFVKRIARKWDPVLLALCVVATGLGLLWIFDAGYARSLRSDHGAIPREFLVQVAFAAVGIFLALLMSTLRPIVYKQLARPMWLVMLILLLVVAKFGHEMNGARRWIGYGFFSLQPAEFAKGAAVLYLGAILADRKLWPKKIPKRRDFIHWLETIGWAKVRRSLPAVWILLAAALIEMEPDLGTAAVLVTTAYVMLWVGGVSRKSLLVGTAFLAIIGYVVVVKEPYRLERFQNHIHRWEKGNIDDTGYQTVQSELAMASGGVGGVGLGSGRAKHLLPATTTDFVMATVAEETGLWGALVVLITLGAIVGRLLWLACRSTDRFSAMVQFGVAAWIGIQTCTNFMMANGFLPAIGIPMPFISSGGSSLVALWMAIGLSQSVRVSATKPSAVVHPEPDDPGDHRWRDGRTHLSGVGSR